jgi:hypothetical protein
LPNPRHQFLLPYREKLWPDSARMHMPRYKVMVDDSFHFMCEEERYQYGIFLTAEEAIDVDGDRLWGVRRWRTAPRRFVSASP